MMQEKIDLIINMLETMKNNINEVEHEIKIVTSDNDHTAKGLDIRLKNIRDRLDQRSKDIRKFKQKSMRNN